MGGWKRALPCYVTLRVRLAGVKVGVKVRGLAVVPVTMPKAPRWLPQVRIGKTSLTLGMKFVGRAMFSVPMISLQCWNQNPFSRDWMRSSALISKTRTVVRPVAVRSARKMPSHAK